MIAFQDELATSLGPSLLPFPSPHFSSFLLPRPLACALFVSCVCFFSPFLPCISLYLMLWLVLSLYLSLLSVSLLWCLSSDSLYCSLSLLFPLELSMSFYVGFFLPNFFSLCFFSSFSVSALWVHIDI